MKRLLIAFIAFFLCFTTAHAKDELLIGLIPEQNVFRQMERYKPLGEYLSQKAGIKVRFTMLSRYGNIIESFEEGKMDGAFWGSFTGALAISRSGVIPLARPLWLDGSSTYHGLIFVKKESGIKSLSEARGKRFAFVDKATTAGFIFPLAILSRDHGLKSLHTFFSEYFFTGSHDSAIKAVLDGEADVGAAKNTIFSLMEKEDPRVKEELAILERSEKVPSNAFAVSKDLDLALTAKLREVLVGMDEDDRGREILKSFGAKSFIATTVEDYKPVFYLAENAGIDLATYDYVNK